MGEFSKLGPMLVSWEEEKCKDLKNCPKRDKVSLLPIQDLVKVCFPFLRFLSNKKILPKGEGIERALFASCIASS